VPNGISVHQGEALRWRRRSVAPSEGRHSKSLQPARGRSALGRVYAIIITAEAHDLNELLGKNALARIYGVRTPPFDGRTSAQYRARLAELEAQAKREKKGGWRSVK